MKIKNHLRVGINGFGRIGRAVFRINHESPQFQIAAINDLDPNVENMAYLLKYDSTYGRFPGSVKTKDAALVVDHQPIPFYSRKNILDVPWERHHIDVVIDATGVSQNVAQAPQLVAAGRAKKVLITHSPKDVDFTMIFGANDEGYDAARHHVISTSICDACAIAPTLRALQDSYGVHRGFLTTLHPWLSYQNLVDGPIGAQSQPGQFWNDFSLGRASAGNLIPKKTTAAEAVVRVLPQLAGKLDAISYRVPTGIVSSADLTIELKKPATSAKINKLFQEQARSREKVFGYTEEPLTSIDFMRSPHSVVLDGRWTRVLDQRLLKLVLWYDNEWSYSHRVVDAIPACMAAATSPRSRTIAVA